MTRISHNMSLRYDMSKSNFDESERSSINNIEL